VPPLARATIASDKAVGGKQQVVVLGGRLLLEVARYRDLALEFSI